MNDASREHQPERASGPGQQSFDPPEPAGHDIPMVSTEFSPDTGRRLKRAVGVLVTILLVMFIAVRIDRFFKDRAVARETQATAAAPRAVDVIAVRPVAAAQRFTLPGQTAAWHASTIFARVNGYVEKWIADIGDHVHKGQLLALIETPDLDAELAGARAALQAAQAQMLARKAEADFSRTTYERWRDSPKGVVSEQEREQKKADYESSVARLKAAAADVALDQARLDQFRTMAQFKQVVAPYDGLITQREIDVGNLVTAGSTSATTPLYVMSQNDPMRVFVDVPQGAAAELAAQNAAVDIQAGGSSAHTYSGHLTRSSGAINVQARTMRMEVDLANPEQTLVPGMYVKVSFALQPRGAVEIPAAALIFRSGGPQVAAVDASGHVRFQPVSIARDDGSVVELDSGAQPGDRIALNLSTQVTAGEVVHPTVVPYAAAPAVAATH